ncbi:kinase-like domain-containing protein [Vararia minispora EC-137]|uniref:Kinase-like domain-containing protein n=1 Tax=Vararia minispora EC-137 TaxID=1314806 RepID=A0ACB8QTQ0_9AGAM|nr:kinase-like domain-containing protein [Vararia minispora EC-137]
MTSGTSSFPRFIGNYELGPRLGSGVSGSTFRATHIHTGQVVALKLQHLSLYYPTNSYERAVYPLIQGGEGMPRLWASGVLNGYDYLAIDLLGASIDNMYRSMGKGVLDIRSALSIAVQMIARLEHMHSRGVLHRDIQLGNAVVGLAPNDKTLYVIDFGFSKKYINPKTNKHITSRTESDFIGNYWFSSVNVHCRSKTCSRRDDLEALALMLIHLLTPGGLPWTRNGIPRDDEAHERLKREKRDTLPEDLCRGLPETFQNFLHYCRGLKFTQQPDYQMWIEEFRELGEELGLEDVTPFLWPPPPLPAQSAELYSKRAQAPRASTSEIDNMLKDLARLNLNGGPAAPAQPAQPATPAQPAPAAPTRPVLAEKANNANIAPAAPTPAPAALSVRSGRHTKAARLLRLAQQTEAAVGNPQLAALVHAFRETLASTGRTLTKEGFAFLDGLHKQLADPDIFVFPLRTSQAQRQRLSRDQPRPREVTAEERRSRLCQLRTGVAHAQNNRALAKMVSDFGRMMDQSTAKRLTKDGLAFLEGVEERLRTLHA